MYIQTENTGNEINIGSVTVGTTTVKEKQRLTKILFKNSV